MTATPERLIEAALFSAGRPMSVDDLVQATHLKPEDVTTALKALQAAYAGRDSALEVVKSGVKWAMAIRTEYAEHAKMLAAAEIPRKVLKTLALIAFHQPIKQADLKDMIGSVVYDHVHELHDRGMVTARQDGITKILTTTERFCEYFGIDATDRDQIRTELAKRVGVSLGPHPSKSERAGPVDEPPAPVAASVESPVAKATL